MRGLVLLDLFLLDLFLLDLVLLDLVCCCLTIIQYMYIIYVQMRGLYEFIDT